MALGVVAPGVDAAEEESSEKKKDGQDEDDGYPERSLWDAIFDFLRGVFLYEELGVRVVREIVLGEESFFVETEITGNGADEAAIEDTAGKLVPVFIFERFEKAGANARRQGNFVQRYFAQLPFAFEAFSEDSPGHALIRSLESISDTRGEETWKRCWW